MRIENATKPTYILALELTGAELNALRVERKKLSAVHTRLGSVGGYTCSGLALTTESLLSAIETATATNSGKEEGF